MENTPSQPSILDSLRTVEFRMNLRGYSVEEVDEYLEKVAVEAEAMVEQLRTTADRLSLATDRMGRLEAELQRAAGERASAPPPPPPVAVEAAAPPPPPRAEGGANEDALQRTLVLAQKFVEQTKRESEAEAADLMKRAEERARGLVAQAEDRARQIAGEAEQRLREEVSRLEGMRVRLASDIDAMNRHLEEERGRIRSSLNEALKWLDEGAASAPPAEVRSQPGAPQGATSDGPSEADAPSTPSDRQPERPAAALGAQNVETAAPAAPRLRSVPGGAGAEALFETGRGHE